MQSDYWLDYGLYADAFLGSANLNVRRLYELENWNKGLELVIDDEKDLLIPASYCIVHALELLLKENLLFLDSTAPIKSFNHGTASVKKSIETNTDNLYEKHTSISENLDRLIRKYRTEWPKEMGFTDPSGTVFRYPEASTNPLTWRRFSKQKLHEMEEDIQEIGRLAHLLHCAIQPKRKITA